MAFAARFCIPLCVPLPVVVKKMPLLFGSAFLANTLYLPRGSTAMLAETLCMACVVTASMAKTPPLPCVTAIAFFAKTDSTIAYCLHCLVAITQCLSSRQSGHELRNAGPHAGVAGGRVRTVRVLSFASLAPPPYYRTLSLSLCLFLSLSLSPSSDLCVRNSAARVLVASGQQELPCRLVRARPRVGPDPARLQAEAERRGVTGKK